ncbi:hypothetical protein F5050DRAFT_1531903, partial [Lentinula boryana]
ELQETRDIEAAELEVAREPDIENVEYNPEVNPTAFESRVKGENLHTHIEGANPDVIRDIKEAYETDPLFKKVMHKIQDHPRFTVTDGLIWTKNIGGENVLCIPETPKGKQSVRSAILEQGHQIVGHFGPQRTADYIRRWYWW